MEKLPFMYGKIAVHVWKNYRTCMDIHTLKKNIYNL